MTSLHTLLQRTRRLPTRLVVVIVFVTGFALGNYHAISSAQSGNTAIPAEAETLFEPFWEVYNLIQSDYLEAVDPDVMLDGAISGLVDSLGDQYSGYMSPDVFPLLNQDLSGEIEGIGVVIRTIEETDEIEIVSVLEGTPAREAGLLPGDIFVKVDGEEVSGFNQLELATRVRGPEGTDVTITVRRDEEILDFTMTRAHIIIPNVESRLLDNNIGYIKLNQFSPEARADLDQALETLDVARLEALILDFRGNPGGLLTTAVDIASAFIPDGVILYEDFGEGREHVLNATGNYAEIDVPIVVLVDESSASASELVAGALQDRNRATVIGETTLGKGTVQTWLELSNGGGVRLTIARWLTPDRHWIHEAGITPDILVEWTPTDYDDPDDPQLDAAVEYLETLVLVPAQ